MKEESEGGYLIPQTAYIDIVKDGFRWVVVRWAGQRFINFGAWIRSFGYAKKEIHPYAEIMKRIKEVGIVK